MDISSVTEAIGLASSAVGLTGKAASTAETIKRLLASDETRDSDETVQLLNTLAAELTAANMTNVQLSESLKTLSQQIRHEDDFIVQKSKYEQYMTDADHIVYKLIDDPTDHRPPHFICPVCLHRDKLISFITGKSSLRYCQTDHTHHFLFFNPPKTPVRQHRGIV